MYSPKRERGEGVIAPHDYKEFSHFKIQGAGTGSGVGITVRQSKKELHPWHRWARDRSTYFNTSRHQKNPLHVLVQIQPEALSNSTWIRNLLAFTPPDSLIYDIEDLRSSSPQRKSTRHGARAHVYNQIKKNEAVRKVSLPSFPLLV